MCMHRFVGNFQTQLPLNQQSVNFVWGERVKFLGFSADQKYAISQGSLLLAT